MGGPPPTLHWLSNFLWDVVRGVLVGGRSGHLKRGGLGWGPGDLQADGRNSASDAVELPGASVRGGAHLSGFPAEGVRGSANLPALLLLLLLYG